MQVWKKIIRQEDETSRPKVSGGLLASLAIPAFQAISKWECGLPTGMRRFPSGNERLLVQIHLFETKTDWGPLRLGFPPPSSGAIPGDLGEDQLRVTCVCSRRGNLSGEGVDNLPSHSGPFRLSTKMKKIGWCRISVATLLVSAGQVFISCAPPEVGAEPVELIRVQRGALPVILSAPHGGSVEIPDGEKKLRGTTVRDSFTLEVTEMVADFLAERLGQAPYFVIADFSRAYVDANRGLGSQLEQAYSGPVSQVQYDAYHRVLRDYVDEVRETYGGGLLIDIHGQSQRVDQIIRGTVNGTTVARLLAEHGLDALIGPNSLFGRLDQLGYSVEPPVTDAPDSPEDETLFIGGYIVRTYGSHRSDGIDAIQIELGRTLRAGNVRRQTARDLAEGIAATLEHYFFELEVVAQ